MNLKKTFLLLSFVQIPDFKFSYFPNFKKLDFAKTQLAEGVRFREKYSSREADITAFRDFRFRASSGQFVAKTIFFGGLLSNSMIWPNPWFTQKFQPWFFQQWARNFFGPATGLVSTSWYRQNFGFPFSALVRPFHGQNYFFGGLLSNSMISQHPWTL